MQRFKLLLVNFMELQITLKSVADAFAQKHDTPVERHEFRRHFTRICTMIRHMLEKVNTSFADCNAHPTGRTHRRFLLAYITFHLSVIDLCFKLHLLTIQFPVLDMRLPISPGLIIERLELERLVHRLTALPATSDRLVVAQALSRVMRMTGLEMMWLQVQVMSIVKQKLASGGLEDTCRHHVRRIVKQMRDLTDILTERMGVYGTAFENSDAVIASISDIQSISQKFASLKQRVERLDGGTTSVTAHVSQTVPNSVTTSAGVTFTQSGTATESTTVESIVSRSGRVRVTQTTYVIRRNP